MVNSVLRKILFLNVVVLTVIGFTVQAQQHPYIGYAYPAGGQQGTTFQVRLGGQALEGLNGAVVSGNGVSVKIKEYYRRINNQELDLLKQQLAELRKKSNASEGNMMMAEAEKTNMLADNMDMMTASSETSSAEPRENEVKVLMDRLDKRIEGFVQLPACASIAAVVSVEVTVALDAEPGEREIRLITDRGISNPMPFFIGQIPEISKPPMAVSRKQILGKEAQALRKRNPGDDEDTITLPCTVNGQIGSSEINRYHFHAKEGQNLVLSTLGRQLVPFIADAVPGWFQPVLALYDGSGKQVAYGDDFRFNPDPTLFYKVPKDGEYTFTIRDSLYRGREDFVYRITIGELPYITSIFPLGGSTNVPVKPKLKGWNLEEAEVRVAPSETTPNMMDITAKKKLFVSNRMSYSQDTLPEIAEKENNDTMARSQKITLPVIVNGRIDHTNDWDVYRFTGKSNDIVVAEIMARRLGSPLDSILKLTDTNGNLVAFNDDHEDIGTGINTHFADSYILTHLPADGTYYLHVGDTARQGGAEYGYRLRVSAPQPDFELRVVPSNLSLRSKANGAVTVYVQRKDGFSGPIKVFLKNAPDGFTNSSLTLLATQRVAQLNIKTRRISTEAPVALTVVGRAKVGGREIIRQAVPAEDRMQAFLWRQLVPAQELLVQVFDPSELPALKRPLPVASAVTNVETSATTNTAAATTNGMPNLAASNTNSSKVKPKFSKKAVAGRLRDIKRLYEEGLLTPSFYLKKVAECEAAE